MGTFSPPCYMLQLFLLSVFFFRQALVRISQRRKSQIPFACRTFWLSFNSRTSKEGAKNKLAGPGKRTRSEIWTQCGMNGQTRCRTLFMLSFSSDRLEFRTLTESLSVFAGLFLQGEKQISELWASGVIKESNSSLNSAS